MARAGSDDRNADVTALIAEGEPRGRRDYAIGVTRTTVSHLQMMIRDGLIKPGEALLRSVTSLVT
jgi:hypothetical protein